MNRTEILLCSLTAILILVVIAVGIDRTFAKPVYLGKGKVVDRSYTAAYSDVVSGTDHNGKPVTTTHYRSEEWNVIISFHGEILPLETTKETWKRMTPSSTCDVYVREGIFGSYDYKVNK